MFKKYIWILLSLSLLACSSPVQPQIQNEGEKQYKSYLENQDVETLKLSAAAGYPEAQKELGNVYYYGKGVEVNYPFAVRWWAKAAAQENAAAQYNLGIFYLEDPIKQDIAMAVMWLERAAANGDTDAPEQLQTAKEKLSLDYEIHRVAQKAIEQREWVIREVTKTAKEYASTHTYRLEDRFVCIDMAIDVWNLLLTKGIKSYFTIGRSDDGLIGVSLVEFIRKMNHIWLNVILSETELLIIETTTGEVFIPDPYKITKYCTGVYLETPAQVKEFEAQRQLAADRCKEANRVINLWNKEMAGRRVSESSYKVQGIVEAKQAECQNFTNDLLNMAIKHMPPLEKD
jgi:hypothetical protein